MMEGQEAEIVETQCVQRTEEKRVYTLHSSRRYTTGSLGIGLCLTLIPAKYPKHTKHLADRKTSRKDCSPEGSRGRKIVHSWLVSAWSNHLDYQPSA